MAEFKFNSESSYSQMPDRSSNGSIQLDFKEDVQPVQPVRPVEQGGVRPSQTRKGNGKALKTLLVAVLCVCLSLGSGLFGAYLVTDRGGETSQPGGTAPVQTPVSGALGTAVIGNSDSSDLTSAASKGIYASVAAKVKPTVVEITTEQVVNGSYFQQYISSGAGSGVLISADGYIITNNHVIEGATKVMVRLTSGTEYEAKVIGSDAQGDIAVIKIEEKDLPYAVVGDSSTLVVGEEVLAIGNPLGALGGSVTNGIISALDREITIDSQKMQLLQTNAAINPGNSGGGLFNMNGELIAIVNAKSSGPAIEGLGFAIPINYAYDIAKELIDNGYVTGRPSLGISYIEIDDYMDLMRYRVNSYGIYVYDGGSTDLKNGDRMIKLGDYEVTNSATLKSAIQSYKVGDTVTITVVRGGVYTDISVTLIEDVPASDGIELQTGNN